MFCFSSGNIYHFYLLIFEQYCKKSQTSFSIFLGKWLAPHYKWRGISLSSDHPPALYYPILVIIFFSFLTFFFFFNSCSTHIGLKCRALDKKSLVPQEAFSSMTKREKGEDQIALGWGLDQAQKSPRDLARMQSQQVRNGICTSHKLSSNVHIASPQTTLWLQGFRLPLWKALDITHNLRPEQLKKNYSHMYLKASVIKGI